MSKNKTENAIIKYLILSCLSQKSLRCDKVRKLKCSFPDAGITSLQTFCLPKRMKMDVSPVKPP
jgi:hypothetical protein